MHELRYSPLDQYRVLQAVEKQCGPYGDKLVLLEVPDLESPQISQYCRILKELGMIEITTYQDLEEDVHYPVCLTAKGMEYLSETNKAFWEQAEKVASDAVKHWTGFDVSSAVKLFKTVVKKYRQES